MITFPGRVHGSALIWWLDDRIISSLKRRAQRNGRSIEAKHRAILESALEPEAESFAELAARLRAEAPLQRELAEHANALLAGIALCAPAYWQAEVINALWARVQRGEWNAGAAGRRVSALMRAPV